MMKEQQGKNIERIGDIRERIDAEDLVVKCGVRVDLKGSEYLVDAIILYGLRSERGSCNIYNKIGKARGVKTKTVMREIAYALRQSFGLPERLSQLVGVAIPTSEIHNALVVGYLGRLLLRNRVMQAE